MVRRSAAPAAKPRQVAFGLVQQQSDEGCTKLIEGIRCETQPPIHSEVICGAARTEVRFSISGED
jgi:hypothetical protein